MAPAASPADLIAAKKPRSVEVPLVLDPDTGATETFTFEAMSRVAFRDMRLDPECAPTAAQKKQHRKLQLDAGVHQSRVEPLDVNPDVFWPRFCAETCTSHPWDEEGWAEFLGSDVLNDAEFNTLTRTAISIQATAAKVPDPEA